MNDCAGEEEGTCEEEYGHVLEEESVVYVKLVIAYGQLGFLWPFEERFWLVIDACEGVVMENACEVEEKMDDDEENLFAEVENPAVAEGENPHDVVEVTPPDVEEVTPPGDEEVTLLDVILETSFVVEMLFVVVEEILSGVLIHPFLNQDQQSPSLQVLF